MRKGIVFTAFAFLCFSCAGQVQESKVQKLNYSLLERIYTETDAKTLSVLSNVVERNSTTLKSPRYIKVYRGSFRDEKGNVVEGGFEWIKVDDGLPDTNF